jgi:hypothetical protein
MLKVFINFERCRFWEKASLKCKAGTTKGCLRIKRSCQNAQVENPPKVSQNKYKRQHTITGKQ